MIVDKFINKKSLFCLLVAAVTMLFSTTALASSTNLTIGGVASIITQSFENLTKLITAGSYIAGTAFSISAVMKFKAHKDNPTQITIGTPIALLFVSAALLFLPTVLGVTGQTLFGGEQEVAGPYGTIFQ